MNHATFYRNFGQTKNFPSFYKIHRTPMSYSSHHGRQTLTWFFRRKPPLVTIQMKCGQQSTFILSISSSYQQKSKTLTLLFEIDTIFKYHQKYKALYQKKLIGQNPLISTQSAHDSRNVSFCYLPIRLR